MASILKICLYIKSLFLTIFDGLKDGYSSCRWLLWFRNCTSCGKRIDVLLSAAPVLLPPAPPLGLLSPKCPLTAASAGQLQSSAPNDRRFEAPHLQELPL
jgi:hypothetical protein